MEVREQRWKCESGGPGASEAVVLHCTKGRRHIYDETTRYSEAAPR